MFIDETLRPLLDVHEHVTVDMSGARGIRIDFILAVSRAVATRIGPEAVLRVKFVDSKVVLEEGVEGLRITRLAKKVMKDTDWLRYWACDYEEDSNE